LVRDPLVIFDKKINITDEQDMSHFETINSSNWNSLRFKLPRPADHDFSYKIEVRTCDLQITPYENITMIHLVMILYHIIIKNLYNFVIPITKVDENFEKAYKIDGINTEKFWWRVNCFDKNSINNLNSTDTNFNYEEDAKKNIKLLSINEIFNGCKEYNYPGILNVIRKDILNDVTDKNKQNELIKFVDFFERKTKGELWTDAKYIRKFVSDHPKYNKDSIITEEINYDLITHLLDIQNGVIKPKELFG
jgi:glutamate--cysteine ligase catalytic subunit